MIRVFQQPVKGQMALLYRLLTAKFGELTPNAQQQLQTAEPEQLEHWAERVLTAETLEQVFSHH